MTRCYYHGHCSRWKISLSWFYVFLVNNAWSCFFCALYLLFSVISVICKIDVFLFLDINYTVFLHNRWPTPNKHDMPSSSERKLVHDEKTTSGNLLTENYKGSLAYPELHQCIYWVAWSVTDWPFPPQQTTIFSPPPGDHLTSTWLRHFDYQNQFPLVIGVMASLSGPANQIILPPARHI